MNNTFKLIALDYARYTESKGFFCILRTYLYFPGFASVAHLRLYQALRRRIAWRIILVPVGLALILHQKLFGYDLGLNLKAGGGFYLPHGGVVINSATQIGSNCYVSQGVTIGKVHTGIRKGVPVLKDDVFIGANSVVLGEVTIGARSVVASNSTVIDDVSEGSFVVGVPAKFKSNIDSRKVLK